jgi:isoleucyl-tRNA synthetase
VFLLDFPKARIEWDNEEITREVAALFEVRADVSKSLESLRQSKTIGSGLDAQVVIAADGAKMEVLKKHEGLLSEFFIVSQVHLKMGSYQVETKKADGVKCERCWYYSTEIGKDPSHPSVCPKCSKALA